MQYLFTPALHESPPQNWGGDEPNRTVTCMVLKATANDVRHLAFCHEEFRGPRSGLSRSGGISNNNCVTSMPYKFGCQPPNDNNIRK
ncbi:uncharacterized protein TNCV_560391 [Trichonephila clavipes]|nr:uncharacterized protein TNCV_560391 [Trichonephila clavipes]